MGCRTCVASREATVCWEKKKKGKVLYLARMKWNSLCHLCSRDWRPAHETIKAKGSGRGISSLAPHSFQGQLRKGIHATGANPILGIAEPFCEGLCATGGFSHKGEELSTSIKVGVKKGKGFFFFHLSIFQI